MPTYEMPLLLRIMSKPSTAVTLKRVAQAIFDKGGFLRKVENIGKKSLPYRMRKNNLVHTEANAFIMYFDVPPSSVSVIEEEYNRDIDIIKQTIFKQKEPDTSYQCTLHEETLPAPYRKTVQEMVKLAKKKEEKRTKYHFKPNTGLDYYPFQH